MSKKTSVSQPQVQNAGLRTQFATGKTFSIRTGVQAGQFGSPCGMCNAVGVQNGWSKEQIAKNCAGVCG